MKKIRFTLVLAPFIVITLLLMTYCSQRPSELERLLSKDALPMLKSGSYHQTSSFDTTGANNDRINIFAGDTVTIFNQEGPGVITRIWITIDSRDPHFLRRILLRFFWDDEPHPSVEVPVGDFFGTGFAYKHYFSEYVGMTSGGYFCYFPMPFNKKARIEVINETGQEIFAFYYQINFQKLNNALDHETGYFHAFWNRDIRTDYPENYTVLETSGQGHLIGVNMSMQPYNRSLWYLEGDEMIFIDGEDFPSVYGTGTEDYFTSGWYFKQGEYHAPYHGLILKDEKNARIAAYRYHIPDPITFQKSLKFTIEHGHNNEEIIDFSSTAFWYQREPHKTFPKILKGNMRIPLRVVVPNGLIEAENTKISGSDIEHHVTDMSDFGAEWSQHKQVTVQSKKQEATFDITIDQLKEKAYDVKIYYTCGHGYSDMEMSTGTKKIMLTNSSSTSTLPHFESIPDVPVKNGKIIFHCKISGKEASNSTYQAGIDGFYLTPVRKYIPEWMVIGPFPNKRLSDILRFGIDSVYAPEKVINYEQTYTGKGDQRLSWKKYKTPESGYFSLWDKVKPYEFAITYAHTYVYAPENKQYTLWIGSDDGIKVFLNGKELHRFLDVRIASPDQDKITLSLKKGWNSLLLKIENNFGGYSFYARIVDPQNELRYSLSEKNRGEN